MKYSRKLPSLLGYIPWKYGFKHWADNGEIKKFPNNLCGPHKPFKTNQLTTYETGDSPAATLSHWGQAGSRKQSECERHSLSNILKLQATFLYSMYHQRTGKTNLFHMRGGQFHAGNTLCTFNLTSICKSIGSVFRWSIAWRQDVESLNIKKFFLFECWMHSKARDLWDKENVISHSVVNRLLGYIDTKDAWLKNSYMFLATRIPVTIIAIILCIDIT